ncbi:MAG: FGGY family carbohydrate kinase [Pseudomonadota bacterium]
MHKETTADLVIGLDSSTQSTKAIAWSRAGEAVAEGRAPIALSTPRPGWVEQDPLAWWAAAVAALRAVCETVDPARIAGIAISNQRETVAFVDADLEPLRPAIVWLDERAATEIDPLSDAFGAQNLHAINGKPPDVTPVLYRLAWMRRHERAILERSQRILDVHGVLTGRLTGNPVASWTSADPFGVLDIAQRSWSAPILDHLGLSAGQFGTLAAPGTPVGRVTASAGSETGLRAGTPVFAAGGDGQCAGLGVDAARAGTVYLNLGTALITGIWSAEPRIARSWRTMTSPTGQGYFLEGCLRAGTFFVDWVVTRFGGLTGSEDAAAAHRRLETEAAGIPLGAEGLTVCPYLSGVMDPHWDPGARAAFLGLSPAHGVAHLYRAALEALAAESARVVAAMRAAGLAPQRIRAIGGGARNALWVQMFADATGLPVELSDTVEASALGAAISAAVGLGWYDGFDRAATAMARSQREVAPDRALAAGWAALLDRQAAAYRP